MRRFRRLLAATIGLACVISIVSVALAEPALATGGAAASIQVPPSTRTHVVRQGETLTAIARRAGVSIAAIRTLNPKSVSATGHIRAGATLLIPAADRARTLPSTLRSNPERLALRPIIRTWAKRNGIPADLVEATLYLESGWNQSRVSSTGAIGVGQLMPATAVFIKRDLIGARAGGLSLDPTKVEDNIRMSARYLRFLLAAHDGDATRALHAYYQGVGSIAARGLGADTVAYAAAIQSLRARFRADPTGLD